MSKVPGGYNAAAEKKAAAAFELVRRHVVPIYALDANGQPDSEGTGTLVRTHGRHLLVSAAHVFRPLLHGGVHLLIEGRSQSPLSEPVRMTVAQSSRSWLRDDFDIGFVQLTRVEAEGLGLENFVDEPTSHAPPRQWWHEHFVVGYPIKSQWRDVTTLTYHHKQTFYTAHEVELSSYSKSGLNRHSSVMIDFKPCRITHSKGAGGKPNFKGMSGEGFGCWIPSVVILSLSPQRSWPSLPDLRPATRRLSLVPESVCFLKSSNSFRDDRPMPNKQLLQTPQTLCCLLPCCCATAASVDMRRSRIADR